MFKEIMKAVESVSKFASSPAGKALIKASPHVVRSIDRWWSTMTYEEVKERLETVEFKDDEKVASIFEEHKAQMSPDVRRAFEERLAPRG